MHLGSYVGRRFEGLTDEQRRVLVYIAIGHYYGQQAMPIQAFAPLVGLPRSKTFELSSAFADDSAQALLLLVESQPGEWRTAHYLVAREIIHYGLSPRGVQEQERDVLWRQNLSSWGKDFADFCRGSANTASDRLFELVRRVFIYRDNVEVLGTESSGHRRFAQLVEDIPPGHGQIEVLRHLTECFPLEAHFRAHLGRFLGLSGEYEEALECLDIAITLQPEDHVLHHMRGMVLRRRMRSEAEVDAGIVQLVETARGASESFAEARRLGPDVEHGYISEVQMLIDLIDRAYPQKQDVVRNVLARPETDPFLRQALERAEDLLDRVQHLYEWEGPSRYAQECRARLQRVYGDFQSSLQVWDSLLSRPEVPKPSVRRQIVWTILRRREGAWDRLSKREANRIQSLLEQNLNEDVKDSRSLRLWLRAIRFSETQPSLDSVIEKVSYWKMNSATLDATYYLYVLHTLQGLRGSSQGAADAERALEECRALAKFRRDRTSSFEWLGEGDGIAALVHQSRLGNWKDDFWESTDSLVRLKGRVASISGPQKGLVELSGGVEAFFVPGKAGLHLGRDENTIVTCYLGFSYDGPRAWDVRRMDVRM